MTIHRDFSTGFAVLLAACLALAGCAAKKSDAPAASAPPEKSVTIGFSLDSLIVERWLRDRDVFVSTAATLGAEVIIQDAANNEREQVNQVRYLIDKGVDVLVIIPQNADLFSDAVSRAHSKGIKVISYDRLIRNAGADLYVSVNSVEVGRLMAKTIIGKAPAGNYVFIDGPEKDNNVTLVASGQREIFGDYPGVFHLLDYHAENWSYDDAFEQVATLLSDGKKIDAIVCGNDGLAGGAIRALAERRLAGKVPVIGQDADIAACQYVMEGLQLATIYKPISSLARQAAGFAVSMARGDYVPPQEKISDGSRDVPVFWLDPVVVTKSNMDEVVIKSGFHTAEEIYHNIPPEKRPPAYR
jgi:D-xylose transport system substrate-binding protein